MTRGDVASQPLRVLTVNPVAHVCTHPAGAVFLSVHQASPVHTPLPYLLCCTHVWAWGGQHRSPCGAESPCHGAATAPRLVLPEAPAAPVPGLCLQLPQGPRQGLWATRIQRICRAARAQQPLRQEDMKSRVCTLRMVPGGCSSVFTTG